MADPILVLNTRAPPRSSTNSWTRTPARARPGASSNASGSERGTADATRSGDGARTSVTAPSPTHGEGLAGDDGGVRAAAGPELGPAAVGHRVVHGGDRFAEAVLIDDSVIAAIEEAGAARTPCTTRSISPESGSPARCSPTCRRSPCSTPRSIARCRGGVHVRGAGRVA
ncbi:hypothetical protein [Nonomuraea rubra]|uniref:hypothetical protein n=1 Tax=Nonomuraea rubra TaxID=46180 RepID=UPI003CD0B858